MKPVLSPLRRKTLTVPVSQPATTRSGLPSPLRSPVAMALDRSPTDTPPLSGTKVSSGWCSSIVTLWLTKFETAMSSRPSPLKSATAEKFGPEPTA